MVLPYLLRLLCLCLAAFFLTHAATALVLWLSAPAALRVAARANPHFSARFLFAFRMFPLAFTALIIFGFCVPSYLWLEPQAAGEKVGYDCLAAAGLGAAVLLIALLRAGVSIVRTNRYLSTCERQGRKMEIQGAPSPVLVVGQDVPVMAIAGVVHPRLIVSQSVMQRLTPEQREAAFRHENAHHTSRDNLKRFFCLLAPDALPFWSGFKPVERQWAKYTEWTADDRAVAGSSERALALAAALVSVAKLGAVHQPPYVVSSLMASTLVREDDNLRVRVDRLLREQQYTEKPLAPLVAVGRTVALVTGGLVALVAVWPESLSSVHRILETLIQ